MKLMFHKQELYGHWFRDKEDTAGHTEKIPPYANSIWDEEINEWVEKPFDGKPEETQEEAGENGKP